MVSLHKQEFCVCRTMTILFLLTCLVMPAFASIMIIIIIWRKQKQDQNMLTVVNSFHYLSCQRSPSCVNIRIHGIGERGSYLLHNFPCQRECRAIYSHISQLLGVPSQLLTLSTGMKILRRGLPLQTYLSDLNLSNGLSLYCNIVILGGGREDDKLLSEHHKGHPKCIYI